MPNSLSRRTFLTRSAAIGCSAAASPLLTPVSFASVPTDNRLVIIILRGAMDGLDVVRPVGDPDYAVLRPTLLRGDAQSRDLDGFFALHPALDPLMPLWRTGELGFVHAVSTPYRNKRSHFDGQDHLEAGLGASSMETARDGWLNRAIGALPGAEADTAFALDRGSMLLTAGEAPISQWAPDADLVMSAQAQRLLEMVVHDDPMFRDAFARALTLADNDGDPVAFTGGRGAMIKTIMADQRGQRRGKRHLKVPAFAAERLRGDTRVAAFSIAGWDTHAKQARALPGGLKRLAEALTTLRDGVGPDIWGKTTVLAMTEFGRTARENGTGGTDHGTGGMMFLAGGAVRGGRVYGQWPGLTETDLFDRRDLMPTGDVRNYVAWALKSALGLDRATLETRVFPGLDMGQDPGIIL